MLLNITTFNLRLNHIDDKENAWLHRLKSVIYYLNSVKPHILGAQEVLDEMLTDLSQNLPDYSYIGVTRKQNEEANPIFYDKTYLECRESGTFWLSRTPQIPDTKDFGSACIRICTWGEFMFKENRNLRFRIFNTHLDHVSNLAKSEGINIILNFINEKNKPEILPFILMGDFNADINDEVIKSLKTNNSLNDCSDKIPENNHGVTYHGYGKITEGYPIDHIFVSGDIKIISTEIFNKKIFNVYPSDHYPLTTIIELEKGLE